MVKQNRLLTPLIAFLWFFLIVIGYYVTHKPISPTQTLTIVGHFWNIIVPIWIFGIAGGIGRRIAAFDDFNRGIRIFLQTAFGLGLLSLLILVIGTIWKINLLIILTLLILLSGAFYKHIYRWFLDFLKKDDPERENPSIFLFTIISLVGIIFLTQILTSLAPATHYDALNYHLTLPKIYLQYQKIIDIPWLVMSGMPQISEMIYLVLLALAGESAVLMFNCLIGGLILYGLIQFLKEKIGLKSAWVGAASIFAGYTFASALSWGYVDLMAAFFGLAFVIMFIQFWTNQKKSLIFLTGIFSGLAFGCKYPAGVIFLAGFLTLIVLFIKTKNSNWLKMLLFYSLGAGLTALPWLLKNLLFTGNPVYPFFFESGSMNQIRMAVYQGLPPYGNLLDFFFLPIQATIVGVDGTVGYSVSIGPLLLGLGIAAFLNWQDKPKAHKEVITITGLIALFGLLVWAIGNQFSGYLIQTRFYFVLFSSFAILAAFGYNQLAQFKISQVRISRLVNALIMIVLVFNAFQLFSEMIEKDVLSNVLGFSTNQEYLEQNLGWYSRAIASINEFDAEEKVLFLYEPRGYGCVPKCDPDEILDQWKVDYHTFKQEDQILSSWRSEGFTYILVYSKGMEFLRTDNDPHHPIEELDALDVMVSNLPLVENYGDWYKLYRINSN